MAELEVKALMSGGVSVGRFEGQHRYRPTSPLDVA